jgi:hypothetical protein
MLNNLPMELRQYNQFVCWKYEDFDGTKPTKVPYNPVSGWPAKVNDPSTWCTFEQCMNAAATGRYDGVGFVLTEQDPFTFIDLDDTEGDKELLDIQMKIFEAFDSYAEISPSGKGLHIIVKGSVPSGRKRSKVEVYSDLRFMTVTGNVYRNSPIRDHNELVNRLWSDMGRNKQAEGHDPKAPQVLSDDEVINLCITAANGEKAMDLAQGDWQKYYSSQSEADLALVNIIAYYTQNREQIARLFKASALGSRNKQTTIRGVDYLNYMINKSFDRLLPPVDIEALQNSLRATIEDKIRDQRAVILSMVERSAVDTSIQASVPEPESVTHKYYNDSTCQFPPGLVGEIAQYIFDSAPRPVKEIALGGAIALMAGIVGRSYNISGGGLNQYVLILAGTGRGKEAIATGIDKIMSRVVKTVPTAMEFIGPAEIASPQALTKYMAKIPCFVSMIGEFGLKLQQLSSMRATPMDVGLRRMILDLYSKSGEGKVVRPTIYSDKDKNTECILSPAFSLMGESTPERFYGALSESMVSEGLLPRFFIIEFDGLRPPLNENHIHVKPSEDLINKVATLCANSQMLNSQNKSVNVEQDYEATQLLNEFSEFCDNEINRSDRDLQAQLWNRGHLKALRLAATVAVGINPWQPCVTADIAQWSINMITRDINSMLTKFELGEIAADDEESKQLGMCCSFIREYLTKDWEHISKTKATTALLHSEKIIPMSYIHKKCSNSVVFRKDKKGASEAIRKVMKILVERGDIVKLSGLQASKYDTTSECYMLKNQSLISIRLNDK